MATDAHDAVHRSLADVADAERAAARLEALRRQLAGEVRARDALRERLAAEERDVDRLEQLSIRSVWAAITGRKDERLTAERAEADGVRLELVTRQAVVQALRRDIDECQVAAGRLRLAREELVAAQAARATEIAASDPVGGAELAGLADAAAAADARIREIDEADRAAIEAEGALAAAADALSSAHSWSTYDTFFGGGVIASAIKHGRLDEAADGLATVQHALRRLRAELADVAIGDDELVHRPSEVLRGLDVWFDNVISDWMVHDRIRASERDVDTAIGGVAELRRRLAELRRSATDELADVVRARDALIASP